jgi:hypothetical protein
VQLLRLLMVLLLIVAPIRGETAFTQLRESHLEILACMLQYLGHAVVALHGGLLLQQLHQLAQQQPVAEGIIEGVNQRIFVIREAQPVQPSAHCHLLRAGHCGQLDLSVALMAPLDRRFVLACSPLSVGR